MESRKSVLWMSAFLGQASTISGTPSPSVSSSHAFPTPSPEGKFTRQLHNISHKHTGAFVPPHQVYGVHMLHVPSSNSPSLAWPDPIPHGGK